MQDVFILDIATIAAVVAALVTVVGNAVNMDKNYRSLLAVAIASVLWFLPKEWGEQVIIALIIGLTASGVYSQVKPRDNANELLRLQMREEIRQEMEEHKSREDRLHSEEENSQQTRKE
ncbi:hypothetical protein P4475_14750 [Halalkalibacterium halodurans]|uniref:Holin n=1 Tax=Halalkalibacterium halodurans TaxID=86665 RepID=A0A0M0KGL9_ALKHA|nr:hypothetical protein [Halalkalibacterium halodurans]MED3648043.1 hypothetical protein [Halalkalibacterium halodurans]MED4163048.1 hypothetical protein [Halalkalibacterium halodurans]TES53713.1 hypothetical protein E2L07_11940 [Halalkalibacterium halodurans]TPE68619.1 hypothetical protein AMD02_012460 [Halalkalibacterium halodurans]